MQADELTLLLAKQGEVPRGQAFQAARRLGLSEFEWKDPSSGNVGRFHTRMAGEGLKLPKGLKESDLYRDPEQERINRDYYNAIQESERKYKQGMADIEAKYALKGLADQEDRERQAESEGELEYLRETSEPSDRAKINQLRRAKAQEDQEGLEKQEAFEGRAERLGEMQDQLAAMNRQIEVLRTRPEDLASDRAKIAATQRAFQQWAEKKKREQALRGVYPETAIPFIRGLGSLFRSSAPRAAPMRYERQEPTFNFASGGAASLAQYGRGGDTMLVHMSPGEVKSLQDLAMAAGGSLTINPTTGLPEAGFLKKLLPTLIGAGLSFIPGVGPLMAAGLVGGFETVRTGDIGKGLMAGLGAYGGAGLAGGLTTAGSAVAGTAEAASTVPGLGGAAGAGFDAAAVSPAVEAARAAPLSTAGQGLSNLASSGAAGEAARSGFMSGVGGLGGLAKYGLAATSPILGAMGEQQQPQMQQTPVMNRIEFQARPVSSASTVPSYDELSLGKDFGRQRQYFEPRFVDTGEKFTPTAGIPRTVTQMPTMANGGEVGNNTSYPLVETPPTAYNTASNRPQQMEVMLRQPKVQYDLGTGQARFAEGGISHLGGYSDGGRMLRGPGDGVSDSIPATIGDRQPARLADGEFVVPARIVSEIGNGSSEAGARKLYAMMDRVQGARKKSIGKGKVAVDSKAEKLLPA